MRKYKEKPNICQEGASTPEGQRVTPGKVGAGLLLAGAGVALGTLAFAWFATHPPRLRVRRSPADFSLEFEPVQFSSADGLKLSGWLIPTAPAEAAKGVVTLCHGYPMNRTEMLPYARFLHDAGYALLLFDFRALGESEGDLCSIGHHEVDDLHGALDYLTSRPDTAELPKGALGLSLGGAVSIMTAARDERLRAVVAEASFPTLQHALDKRFWFTGPLSPLITRPVRWWGQRWFPVQPGEVAPGAEISAISPRAVMLIQGKRDLLVDWRETVAMYEAAGEPRELWLMPRSHHARCLRDEPEEYARRVTAFFDRHLAS